MKLWPDCREVTRLVLQGQDRALPWHERTVVRLHQGICEGCTRFARQVRLMNGALPRWRRYREDADAD